MNTVKQLHWTDPDPAPTTAAQAEEFLRKRTNTQVAWKEDYDLLKCTAEAETPDADKRKYYQEVELYKDDAGNDQKILRLAREAHAFIKKVTAGGSIS